jgi:alpha-N-arabinofuranosidase
MGRRMRAAVLVAAVGFTSAAGTIGGCGGPSAGVAPTGGDDAGDATSEAGDSSAAGDAGFDADGGLTPDVGPLPDALIEPDPSQSLRQVSPLLFGEGMEWTHYGQDVMLPDPTGATSGTFRPELVSALKAMNIPVMRYPGGTLSDLFHWNQTVGPMPSRVWQPDQSAGPDGGLPTLPPNFGPDEYAQFAAQIGADMHITVNVGTGSSADAAAWVSYYLGKGIHVKYVEVGNEVYLGGPGSSYPAMAPADYAAKFDEYASAVRAVDPNVQVMAIGCMIPNWSIAAMGSITQKADYVAVHVAYFPFDSMNTAGVDTIDYYWAMMGGTQVMTDAITALETVVSGASKPINQAAPLAMTEHSSLFYPGGSDVPTLLHQVQRNQTLAAAVFSASSYQIMMRDPRITYANHINPLSPFWEASITVAPEPTSGYPGSYNTQPTMSAFGYAYQLYRQGAGGTVIATQASNVPTFDTPPGGVVPAETGLPALDPISVKMPDGSLYLYVVNRDLLNDVGAQVSLPGATSVAAAEQLNGPAYNARNDPTTPNVVMLQSLAAPPVIEVNGVRRFVATFPAHSVTRFTLK